MSEKDSPPRDSVPDQKPIASGSAFIGLCGLRSNAVQMLWQRVQLGITLNVTALVAAGYQLSGTPGSLVLMLLMAGSLAAMYLNGYWRELISSGKRTEEYWTEELVQLEERNPIEGCCRIFNRQQFPAPTGKPRVPKVLRNMRRGGIVLWGVVAVWSTALLLKGLEESVWKLLKLWQCS